MKRFFRIASMIGCLFFCLVMANLQVSAVDVSTTAISLDLAAGSVEIYESEGVTYCVQNEDMQATTGGVILRQSDSGTTAISNTVTVSGGSCSVTISSLNIEAKDSKSPILVKKGAALDLRLLGSSTVKAGRYCAGIEVPGGANLIINGDGSITANGSDYGAGIGGHAKSNERDGGAITINSGIVTANGGTWGAGIGGGCGGNYYVEGQGGNGGSITINGGTITASGGSWGAGIGGGCYGGGGNITINGGTITASGGNLCAGIGGGYNGVGGSIIINGGTVTAIGYAYASVADIGASNGGIFDAVSIFEDALVTGGEGNIPNVKETIFIDKQPLASAAYLNNTPASFVEARNHSGIAYQWQTSSDKNNWVDIETQTSTEISFAMTEEWDGAYLRCKLTNGWGNLQYTDAVQIYVLAFAQQPTNVEANLNDIVAFEATSTCSNVAYQWQRSYDDGVTWSNVPNETYSTLIVNVTLSESSAEYRCIITATNGDQLASDVVSVNLDLGELVTYTVQDYLQNTDGVGYTMGSQQVLEGISGETVNVPTDGYDGFKLNKDKSVLSGTVTADNTLVLIRYFDRKTYSISFETNGGGALPDLKALYGAPVEEPNEPSRYGYVFDGWYANKKLTKEYSFDTMPMSNITVYAKWEPVGADRGVEYTINGLTVRDSSTYEVMDYIPADDFLVEVSVTNLEATETDTILLAYYTEQGQMLGMNYMFAKTKIGDTVTFGASVENSTGNVGSVKAFILPTLGNPYPLAEAKTIEKNAEKLVLDATTLYADGADIHKNAKNAVELMYALNLMKGDSKGNFNPSANITRAEAAKLIYVILNHGKDDGATNYTGTKIFSDVEEGTWYEGYINYCAASNIAVEQGLFRPTDELTCTEATRMLLCAIGYSAASRGYTNESWDKNVLSDSAIVGLLNHYNANVNTYVERQWFAVLLENMLVNTYTVKANTAFPNGVITNDGGGKYILMGVKYLDLDEDSEIYHLVYDEENKDSDDSGTEKPSKLSGTIKAAQTISFSQELNAFESLGDNDNVRIQFTSLPKGGKLFYNYGTAKQEDVTVGTNYYLSASSEKKQLSYVTFVPSYSASKVAQTISFGVKGYDKNGKTSTGTVNIDVTYASRSAYFTDVNTSTYADSVDFLYNRGITTGLSVTTFGLNSNVTRGQFVTFLYRAAGQPVVTAANKFTDVKSSDYYYNAVRWAVSNGIISDTTSTTFDPHANITYQSIITFLYNYDVQYLGHTGVLGSSSYVYDYAKVAEWAQTAVKWAVGKGVISAGNLNPTTTATRANVALYLHRALTL